MTASKPTIATPREAVVATNLRTLRKTAGISQGELSRLVAKTGYDLSEQAIGNIEIGKRRVQIDDLIALGEALGVPAMSLLRPDAGSGVVHEVVFESGTAERVLADEREAGEQWIDFRLQGQLVYSAAVGRVFSIRILADGASEPTVKP